MMTATMAVIQLGTLAAVFVYFAADIWGISSAFIRDHFALLTGRRGMRFSGTDGVRPIWLSEEAWLGWLIIIGSIPIGTIGLAQVAQPALAAFWSVLLVGERLHGLQVIGMVMVWVEAVGPVAAKTS